MAAPLALGLALETLSTSVKAATQAFTTATSVYADVGKGLISINTSLIKAFTGLDFSLRTFANALGRGFTDAKNIQGQAAMIGMTFRNANTLFANQIKDLPGSIARNLETGLFLFGEGLRGNTSMQMRLANEVRLAGGNSRQFANELLRAAKARGMDQMLFAEYTESIRIAARSNKLDIQNLAETLSGFAQSTQEMSFLFTKEQRGLINDTVIDLAAMAGLQQDVITPLFAPVFTGGLEDLQRSIFLGYFEQIKILQDDLATPEMKRQAGIDLAKAIVEAYTIPADADPIRRAYMTDLFKDARVTETKVAAEKFLEGIEMMSKGPVPEEAVDFTALLNTLQENLERDFEQVGIDFLQILTDANEVVGPELAKIASDLAGRTSEIFKVALTPENVRAVMGQVISGLTQFKDTMLVVLETFGISAKDLPDTMNTVQKVISGVQSAFLFATNALATFSTFLLNTAAIAGDAFASVLEPFQPGKADFLRGMVDGIEDLADNITVANAVFQVGMDPTKREAIMAAQAKAAEGTPMAQTLQSVLAGATAGQLKGFASGDLASLTLPGMFMNMFEGGKQSLEDRKEFEARQERLLERIANGIERGQEINEERIKNTTHTVEPAAGSSGSGG